MYFVGKEWFVFLCTVQWKLPNLFEFKRSFSVCLALGTKLNLDLEEYMFSEILFFASQVYNGI